jgi:hypothetical protein
MRQLDDRTERTASMGEVKTDYKILVGKSKEQVA